MLFIHPRLNKLIMRTRKALRNLIGMMPIKVITKIKKNKKTKGAIITSV